MVKLNWFDRLFAGLAYHRRIKTRIFAGNPALQTIGRHGLGEDAIFSLLFKNGLILSLGEAGILDFQDRSFSQFLGGPGFESRQALTHLHKIVLRSLIRYMVQPRLEPSQRERCAEAASKLYLAEAQVESAAFPPEHGRELLAVR